MYRTPRFFLLMAVLILGTLFSLTTVNMPGRSALAVSHLVEAKQDIHPAGATTCPPPVIHGVLGQGSKDYPSTSGMQTGRFSPNGIDISCISPKGCPPIVDTDKSFVYDAYQFQNTGPSFACVTVTFEKSCGPNEAIHPVIYLGPFLPSNICLDYIGDFGQNIDANTSGSVTFNLPSGITMTLVVHQTDVSTTCSGYSFSVTGLPGCNPPCPPSDAITSTLGSVSANGYPKTFTGVRTEAIGLVSGASTCDTAPTCSTTSGFFRLDAYTFTNPGSAPACVTATLASQNGTALAGSAYLTIFDGANACTNLLGFSNGCTSGTLPSSFSFNVPAGATFIVVVNECSPRTGSGTPYSLTVSGVCPSGLLVTKTDSPDPVLAGGDITYTITLSNNGSGEAQNVVLNDNIPANTTLKSFSQTSGPLFNPASGGGSVSWSRATLAAGASATFQIVVTVGCSASDGSTITNTAQASSTTTGSDPVNISDTETTAVQNPPPTFVTACPATITAATAPSCPPRTSGFVNFIRPTAADQNNCPVTVVCSPDTGSVFPVGTTTVICTATDAANQSISCSFSLTVFNACIQNDANPGQMILFNTITGDYIACGGALKLRGRGRVTQQGCLYMLEHNAPDRRVFAKVDFTTKTGSGSVQMPPGTTRYTIYESDVRNNTCACSVP